MPRLGLLFLLLMGVVSSGRSQTQPSTPNLVVPGWCHALPRPGYRRLERISLNDSWFEAYSITPGVIAIYEPHQWEETVMYLVQGTNRALLFDTGMGIGNLKGVIGNLTKLPVIVVNSHTHPDHTGSNWQFETVYNLDSDYARQNALGSTDIREEIDPGKICGALPKDFDAAAYTTRPWKTTKWMHDGDVIDLGGRKIKVMATPGHAPDSICLFDEANGLLFTGDTFYPGPIYVFGTGADPAAYQKSVNRLAALAPRVRIVLGGHNEPITSGTILPELAREFNEIRVGEIVGTTQGQGITKYTGPHLTFFVRTGQ